MAVLSRGGGRSSRKSANPCLGGTTPRAARTEPEWGGQVAHLGRRLVMSGPGWSSVVPRFSHCPDFATWATVSAEWQLVYSRTKTSLSSSRGQTSL